MEPRFETQKQRIVYLDLLRIFAIFSMMLLHVSASNWNTCPPNTFEWQVFNIYDSLVRFCVPVFVMISGALFLDERKIADVKKIYKHNIFKIVTAYVFWSFLYAGYSFIERIAAEGQHLNSSLLKEFACNLIYGHYHMWFLFIIVGLYMIAPLLRKISEDKSTAEYFLLLSFLFCYCMNLLKLIPNGCVITTITDKVGLDFVLGYSGYYLLGHYLHKYEVSRICHNCINILALLSILFTIAASGFYSCRLGEPKADLYSYLLPNTLFFSMAVFLSFKKRFSQNQIKADKIKIISKISSLSFGMYLAHDFFNMLFQRVGLSSLAFNPVISVPIISIAVFFCSMITVYLLSKVPFLRKYVL